MVTHTWKRKQSATLLFYLISEKAIIYRISVRIGLFACLEDKGKNDKTNKEKLDMGLVACQEGYALSGLLSLSMASSIARTTKAFMLSP